jgi:enoyl-CoA hydratase/carnithine racemase
MGFVESQRREEIATVTLRRGKVNALNPAVIEELRDTLTTLEAEASVRGVILTGAGKFFSFGFDVPELLSFSKERFTAYLGSFTDLYDYLFLYPKPLVAALNGHAVAGGCMLALACDHRVMVSGNAKIGLNEIDFGSSVFAGSTEMLRFWVGDARATEVLYSGAMYGAEEAKNLGLVQEVAAEAELIGMAGKAAIALASRHPPAFSSIKRLLRQSVAEAMRKRERDSIEEFVEIWYSESTRARLRDIKIH